MSVRPSALHRLTNLPRSYRARFWDSQQYTGGLGGWPPKGFNRGPDWLRLWRESPPNPACFVLHRPCFVLHRPCFVFIFVLFHLFLSLAQTRFAFTQQPLGQRALATDSIASGHIGDTHKLLFLGPKRPIRLRITFSVDGAGLDVMRTDVARRVFEPLDLDRNGRLDSSEASNIPVMRGEAATLGDDWKRLDTAPEGGDGLLTFEEVASYVNKVLGESFSVQPLPSRASHAVRLFERLDANHDRIVSQTELAAAETSLDKLDYDDDDTVSTVELLPFENPLLPEVQDEPPSVEIDAPFVDLGQDDGVKRAVAELISLYERDRNPVLATGLEITEIGLSAAEFVELDQDKNGVLDAAELTFMCETFLPDVELSVVLPARKRVRPTLNVLRQSPHAELEVKRVSPQHLSLTIDNVELSLRALSLSTQSYDNRQYYKLQFLMADGDKNRYLEPEEFNAVGLAGVSFDFVDSDKDGKVTRDELIQHVQRDAISSQSRLVMGVGKDGETLFEAADANYDQRLAPRELRNLKSRFQSFDRDGDGVLESTELSHQYRITFSMGKPRLFNESTTPMRRRRRGSPMFQASDGPDWFRHMDRNQDGDLSWREFLGTRSVFARLDSNGDGLVTPNEAAEFSP